MHQINFILGSLAIALAMGLRLSHPAPAPNYQAETDDQPPGQSNDGVTDSNKGTAQSGEGRLTEPESANSDKAPRLVLPPPPLDQFAPGLDEFKNDSEAILRRRLENYLKQGDSVRALLAVERLLERGSNEKELRTTWARLTADAPLWQPDPKDRRSVAFEVTVTLPRSTTWDAKKAKQKWQQEIVQMSGGLILPRITILKKHGDAPSLVLGAGQAVAIEISDEGFPMVDQALATALQQAAGLSRRPASRLGDALTRREWDRLGR